MNLSAVGLFMTTWAFSKSKYVFSAMVLTSSWALAGSDVNVCISAFPIVLHSGLCLRPHPKAIFTFFCLLQKHCPSRYPYRRLMCNFRECIMTVILDSSVLCNVCASHSQSRTTSCWCFKCYFTWDLVWKKKTFLCLLPLQWSFSWPSSLNQSSHLSLHNYTILKSPCAFTFLLSVMSVGLAPSACESVQLVYHLMEWYVVLA